MAERNVAPKLKLLENVKQSRCHCLQSTNSCDNEGSCKEYGISGEPMGRLGGQLWTLEFLYLTLSRGCASGMSSAPSETAQRTEEPPIG